MSEMPTALLALLFDWSIRFGVLILGLMAWFWFRPPTSVFTRLFLGHLVLFAGLALPLTPRWWSIPWPAKVPLMTPSISWETSEPEEAAMTEMASSPSRPAGAILPPSFLDKGQGETSQPVSPLVPTVSPEPAQPVEPNLATSQAIPFSWPQILMAAWVLGASFFLFRIAVGYWWLGRIKRSSRLPSNQLLEEWEQTRKELGVSRKVPLRESPCVATATLLGGRQPIVAIPLDWECEAPENRRAGFLHEWAHIQHRDDWSKTRDELVRSIFFFHPLVHWLINRLALDRELRCDAIATRNGVSGRDLANFLLAQVKKLGTAHFPLLAPQPLSFFQSHSARTRIHKLLEPDPGRCGERVSRVQGTMAALVVFAAAFGVGGLSQASPSVKIPPSAAVPEKPDMGEAAGTVNFADVLGNPTAHQEPATWATPVKVALPDGQPAKGAQVLCVLRDLGPLQTLEGITDDQGMVRFFLRSGASYQFSAILERMGGDALNDSGSLTWKIDSKQQISIPIHLEVRGTFRGRLCASESDEALTGAKIILDNGMVVLTDGRGQWVVNGLRKGAHQAVVSCPNRARMAFNFDSTHSWETDLLIRVPKAIMAHGKVVDQHGNPIPGAWVCEMVRGGSFAAKGKVESCDSQGRFTFPLLPDQNVELLAGAPGFFMASRKGWVDEKQPQEWVVRLIQRITQPPVRNQPLLAKRILTGKVMEPSGVPGVGVSLWWCPSSSWEKEKYQTDSLGEFRITTNDEAGVLAVMPKQWEPKVIPIAQGAVPYLQANLKKGTSIAAKVVDDQGQPVSGVQVGIGTRDSRPLWFQIKNQVTNEQGAFSIEGVPQDYQILCWKKGWLDWSDAISGELAPIIKLKREASPEYGAIKGRVVDQDGKPIPHFHLTISSPFPLNPGEKIGKSNRSHMSVAISHPQGQFILNGLEIGCPWFVSAYSNHHGSGRLERAMAVPMSRLDSVPESILKTEPLSLLRIETVDSGGKPIEGARVELVDNPSLPGKTTQWFPPRNDFLPLTVQKTNVQGVANWKNLPISRGTILVDAPGFGRWKKNWDHKTPQVKAVLRPEAKIVLAYSGPYGQDETIDGELVSSLGDVWEFSLSRAEGGKMVFHGLYEGPWTLKIGTDFYPPLVKENLLLISGQTTIMSKKSENGSNSRSLLTK